MFKLIGVLAFVLVLTAPSYAQSQLPIRVKCGGPAYTDSNGHAWQADTGFNTGTASSFTAKVVGTLDPTLYLSNRYNSNTAKPLTYTFPVTNGSYQVNLYFAETDTHVQVKGGRVFNVKVEGSTPFPNFDIFAEAGANTALEKSTTVAVTNGALKIEFDNIVQNAKINAIEIVPATSTSSAPILTLNFTYPDGTPVPGTLTYTVTSALLSLQGGQQLTNGQATAQLFANPSALGISAQFQVKLTLTDTAGHLLWQLNLGMNPAEVNLTAVQASTLNVVVQRL